MQDARKKSKDAKLKRIRQLHAQLAEAVLDLLPDASFAEREEAMLELTNDLRKEIAQRDLQAVADGLGDEVQVKGKTYRRHRAEEAVDKPNLISEGKPEGHAEGAGDAAEPAFHCTEAAGCG